MSLFLFLRFLPVFSRHELGSQKNAGEKKGLAGSALYRAGNARFQRGVFIHGGGTGPGISGEGGCPRRGGGVLGFSGIAVFFLGF
jgi:hypothetical protein